MNVNDAVMCFSLLPGITGIMDYVTKLVVIKPKGDRMWKILMITLSLLVLMGCSKQTNELSNDKQINKPDSNESPLKTELKVLHEVDEVALLRSIPIPAYAKLLIAHSAPWEKDRQIISVYFCVADKEATIDFYDGVFWDRLSSKWVYPTSKGSEHSPNSFNIQKADEGQWSFVLPNDLLGTIIFSKLKPTDEDYDSQKPYRFLVQLDQKRIPLNSSNKQDPK
jgi:hypothetical protein